jgi:hypothetical protein
MLGDIFEGAVRFGTSYIGGKKRLARRDAAQAAYDESMSNYFAQDTSNLFANMENTMEDLTVNTQAADFAAAQQAQGLSDILGQTRQAAGGSGIAALAQSLANQQSQNAIQASASIGQQEVRNQALAAQQAGRLQMAERRGEAQSRALEAQLLGEKLQIDTGELQQSEAAIQAARAQRAEGLGQIAGGVGNAIGMGIGGPAAVLGQLTDAAGNPLEGEELRKQRAANFRSNFGTNLANIYTNG